MNCPKCKKNSEIIVPVNTWISTAEAGVFYVSSDGQNTIHHFTKDNSPLPSNGVNDMALDSENGIVYFGTNRGLVSFKTGGSSTTESLESVYIYPNPVRPGFNMADDKIKIKNINPKPVKNAPIKKLICLFCSSICPV